MPGTFYIKQNDTSPSIQEQLLNNGSPQVLTGATIKFHLRNTQNGTTAVNATGTIVNASTGIVQYDWISTDTATAGSFLREWEVTLAGGKIITFPNDEIGYDVTITDDIA